MAKPVYQRVLLKISGEALAGDQHSGLNFEVIGQVCDVIKECLDMGVQVGLVVGGGNFWRGAKNSGGKMERTRADHMGMLATVMNCLAVADVCCLLYTSRCARRSTCRASVLAKPPARSLRACTAQRCFSRRPSIMHSPMPTRPL